MTKCKIKKGDQVIVIAGSKADKGRTGEVLKVFPKDSKVLVQGVNVRTKHQKPSAESTGGIVKKELPVHISNVALMDPETGKPTRVGYSFDKDGNKIRVARPSGKEIK